MLLLWCLSMIQVFSYPLGESSFHLFVDLKQAIVSVVAELCLNFEKFFHKCTTSLFFWLLIFQQLRYNLLERVLSKLICGRSWHFLLHSVIPMIYLLFFLPEALWCWSFHSSSQLWGSCSFRAYPSNRSVVSSLQILFILSSLTSLFNQSAAWILYSYSFSI